jgi:hypothetical protein
MFTRWSAGLSRAGLQVPLIAHGGLHVAPVAKGDADVMAAYLAKQRYQPGDVATPDGAAWETVGGTGKAAQAGNRTPFDILRDVVAVGLADDLDLWHEWETASKGRRQITWSAGLRKQLAVTGPELTDEQAAAEDLGGDVVAVMPADVWAVWRWRSGQVLDALEADDHGRAVRALLGADAARCEWWPTPVPAPCSG